ncbi:MAG: GNAT family N-acetyltransferase [Tannerella sp.]|jgi:ribosomal protein S18 acetylase RimI-like enzyme|nr:GNAT family N-acetyltransferase [Tannerella sp.]
MKYTRIKNTKHPLFVQVWNLYKKSFPPEERRQLRTQSRIMDNPLYHAEVITDKNKFIGFILWWGFENIRYIEHLATSPRLRGKGYGRRVLEKFISKSTTPVLLEVEHPTTEISKRRIGFYQRTGFVLNEHIYKHPPYKKGGEYVSLMLMTCPDAITEKEANRFCEEYHPVIHASVLGSK